MYEPHLPAVNAEGKKVKRFTRRHLYSARRVVAREAKALAKVDIRIARSRGRRDERRFAAFKDIPAESTLALLGEDA
jgi:hypothetical protein